MAHGQEPGLRSPLADQLALAACVRTGLPCQLYITGLGMHGELCIREMKQRIGAEARSLLGSDAWKFGPDRRLTGVFTWHPSEPGSTVGLGGS